MTDQKHDAQEWFDQQQPDLQKFITHALTAYPGYGLAGFAEVPDGWDDTLPADRIDFLRDQKARMGMKPGAFPVRFQHEQRGDDLHLWLAPVATADPNDVEQANHELAERMHDADR